MKCPKCSGTNLSAQKAGFGLGKAAAGAILTGGVGLMAGFLGSNKMVVHCLDCGNSWNQAELAKKEERERIALSIKAMDEEIEALKKEMEAPIEEPGPRRHIAVFTEAGVLISTMYIDFDLSDDDHEKLDGYMTALLNGEFSEADWLDLQTLDARHAGETMQKRSNERAAARKKIAEAIKEEPERNASPVAVTVEVWLEAQKLIGDMVVELDLSMDDLDKLDGYNTALGNDEFGEADWRNLQAFNARLLSAGKTKQ